jgi:oligosaccharide repeat unit polymerase
MILAVGALAMTSLGIAIVGPSVVFGFYTDLWTAKMSGADVRFLEMGVIFAEAGIFALIATHDPRRPMRLVLAFAIAALIAVIASQKGDRSSLIAVGIGAGWCYSQRVRRVPMAPVIAAAVIAILVMPVIKEWREDRSPEQSQQRSAGDLIAAATYEMGSTVNCFIYTLDLIPSMRNYDFGLTFVTAGLHLIPNIGLTPGKSFLLDLEHNPSHWITFTLDPDRYANASGFGYAMGAEWYFNFGVTGVLVGVTFLGWLTGRIRNAANESPMLLVWSSLFFAAMVMYVRNAIGHPIKYAVWPLIGLLIIRAVVRVMSGRRSAPRPRGLPAA